MGQESLGLLLLSIVLAGASREPSFIVFSAESRDFTLTGQGSKVALISMPGRHQQSPYLGLRHSWSGGGGGLNSMPRPA